MGSNNLPEFVQELLSSIAKENGFVEFSVNSESRSQIVDGFMSVIISISITDNGSDKRLDLICKMAPQNENHRKELFSNILFDREALFYDKLMPIFAQFQVEKCVPREDQFISYPKCFGTISNAESGQFTIILEDLRPQGFTMWDKTKPSPIENVKLVMRELGKFHGLSFAMKDQKPSVFAEFENVKENIKKTFISENMQTLHKIFFGHAIESLKNEEHKHIMTHIKDNLLEYLDDCIGADAAGPFGILCHGHSWSNNVLYKSNKNGVAEEMRLLDFQIMQHGSPAIDILYFLFLSTDKAFRDKEYDNMIRRYYESLSKIVKLLGSNPDKLFTFKNLQDELRRYGNFVLIAAPSMMEIQHTVREVSDVDEVFDKLADGNADEVSTGITDDGHRAYVLRLNEIVDDIVSLGYYHKVN